MKVTLTYCTPLHICSNAIRTCYQSFHKSDNGGDVDMELIDRVGNKYKHSSTLEHLHFNFYIKGISRACLQELSRHRLTSLSVKSTRYTLKELKGREPFTTLQQASEFIVLTGNDDVDNASLYALENLRKILTTSISFDLAKYALPESYKTELSWSINARSLQNFLTLRTSSSALWEIRELAYAIYEAIPQTYKFIFKECVK